MAAENAILKKKIASNDALICELRKDIEDLKNQNFDMVDRYRQENKIKDAKIRKLECIEKQMMNFFGIAKSFEQTILLLREEFKG